MESTRQKKIAKTILIALSEIFQKDIIEFQNRMITINGVRVTSDLQLARVYFTCFPENNYDFVLKYIEKEQKTIRFKLAAKIKSQMRVIPEIEFYKDEIMDENAKIESLFKQVEEDNARIEEEKKNIKF